MELIQTGDPLVLVGDVPASGETDRQTREHEAGLCLLRHGMALLGFAMSNIVTNEYGKPYFEEEGLPNFSISHSGGRVACALSSHEIGCDIERLTSVPRILDKELEKVRRFVPDARMDDYDARTKLWTVYEALAKADGKGIPLAPRDIECCSWHIRTWLIEGGCVLSSATREMWESIA